MTWEVSDESIGIRSGRKFLEVTNTEPNSRGHFAFFPVASISGTETFTREQRLCAAQLAQALNKAAQVWNSDHYHQEYKLGEFVDENSK